MTPFWQVILFASLWSAGMVGIPGYFATRALLTGRVYDEATATNWAFRTEHPVRFWSKVVLYYAFSLFGFLPWVLILLFGIKE